MASSSKVLVTGGHGFIGRHLAAALQVRGETVRILDIADADPHCPRTDFIQGSVLDARAVAAAMSGVDRVYHLAGIPHLWRRDRADFGRINVDGTRTVMAEAKNQGVGRVIHCSTESILLPKRPGSGSAIDGSACPPAADMPGPYTRSKHLAEEVALDAARGGLDVVVVNPTVPVGPGDHNRTPPAEMLALFLNGGSPAYLECVLNLVDVRDVAAGILLAEQRGRTGERYVLGGENLRLSELLRLLEEISGKPMPKLAIPASLALAAAYAGEWVADRFTGRRPAATREGVRLALRSSAFDSRKAREELGYAPGPIRPAITEIVAALAAARPDKSGMSARREDSERFSPAAE